MKIRLCFVSNSSSSSCVCDLCGRSETGWDLSARDAEMFNCVNGHTICNDEGVMSFDDAMEKLKSEAEAEGKEAEEYDEYDEYPECMCPICSMLEFAQSDLHGYLKRKTGITDKEVFDTVKAANKRRKKLYDSEYVVYTLQKTNLRMEDLIKEIKDNCKTYSEFRKACR
jgi:hypothetical protein